MRSPHPKIRRRLRGYGESSRRGTRNFLTQSWPDCVLMVCGQLRGDGGTLAGGSWLASFSAGASSLISRTPPLVAIMRYGILVALTVPESSKDTKSSPVPPPSHAHLPLVYRACPRVSCDPQGLERRAPRKTNIAIFSSLGLAREPGYEALRRRMGPWAS